jgi:hypothetical protein
MAVRAELSKSVLIRISSLLRQEILLSHLLKSFQQVFLLKQFLVNIAEQSGLRLLELQAFKVLKDLLVTLDGQVLKALLVLTALLVPQVLMA